MDGGNAIGAMRTDDREVRHADLSFDTLLDQADDLNTPVLAREARLNIVDEAAVDLVNNLEVARQHDLEPGERPLLERLGKERMVGVGEGACSDVPGFAPREMALVEQNTHQLRDGNRRVRVVQLNRGFFGEGSPIGVAATEAAHDIGEGAGGEEVLLHETQALAHT